MLTFTGACATKCRGTESCYIGHNCTHYEHCYAWNGAECHCTLMVCSFGTFWNSKINNCDMVAQVDCKSGKEKRHSDTHVSKRDRLPWPFKHCQFLVKRNPIWIFQKQKTKHLYVKAEFFFFIFSLIHIKNIS